MLSIPVLANAQEVADTIRVKTRVVFLDALVKDKRTGVPIADLKPDNFEVFDDGAKRPISYFTRDGQARKPLAFVVILDLRDDGAGRFLKRPEVLKTITDELSKLGPNDEVAILAMAINGEDEKRVWLSDFTRDPAQLTAGLMRAPQFVDVEPHEADRIAAKENEKEKSTSVTVSIGGSSEQKTEEPPTTCSAAGNSSSRTVRNHRAKILFVRR